MKKALACVVVLAMASTASATVIHTNEADFLNVLLPGYYLEDFTGWTWGNPWGPGPTEADFGPVNGWSWHVAATGGNGDLWSNDSALSTQHALDELLITFPAGPPVTAVGGIFAATDYFGDVHPYTCTVTLSDASTAVFAGEAFVGFTSMVPITSLTVEAPDDVVSSWPQMDHFYVGSAIPEPTTLTLLGLGGLLVGWRRRRRR